MPDHALGRFMNHNLAEYHIPANADVRDIDVIFVEEQDRDRTRSASRAWARSASSARRPPSPTPSIHATGKRVRDLPITIDKLMA